MAKPRREPEREGNISDWNLGKIPHFGQFKDLGAIFKKYEKEAYKRDKIDNTKPYAFRLDGHAFRTFARAFIKPFDIQLHAIMVKTTIDLVKEYHAITGYTQSDEITLIFNTPEIHEGDTEAILPFGGKIVKTCTLMASYATARFNYHAVTMAMQKKWNTDNVKDEQKLERIRERLMSGKAHFDCRVFSVENIQEALLALMWRSNYDNKRNTAFQLGRKYYSNKELQNVSVIQLLQKLKEEKKVHYEDQHPAFQFGTILKKDRVMKEATNAKTGETVMAQRSMYRAFSLSLENTKAFENLISVKCVSDLEDDDMLKHILDIEHDIEAWTQPNF